MELEAALAILQRTPRCLAALLGGLPEQLLVGNEGPGTFSPRDVVGHLIHGEETDWVPRIRIILEHGTARPFTPFDRTGFRAALAGSTTTELLDRFRDLRARNLSFVEELHLQPDQLGARGMHPALGEVTLGQLMASWAVHDLGHIAQAARVAAQPFRESVGPWKDLLTILGK
jgi:hypothetical protein